MKRKIFSLFIALGLVVSSCDMDLLDNPNAVTISTASPDFLLTRVQVEFASFVGGTGSLGNLGMRATRLLGQTNDVYEQAIVPQTLNGPWNQAYSSILNDIEFLLPIAERSNLRRHMGIARVIKAFTLMTMVDFFGDIPYSEALDPSNFNPKLDQGATVYAAALAILQQAKADFTATSAAITVDLYYNGNATRWLKLINTLELKYHLNRKLIDAAGSRTAINALITGGNLLAAGDDFVFQYGRNNNDPDSRHPRFAGTYTSGGGDYQATWLMHNMLDFGPKGINDPRVRYYFYRQRTADTTDPDELRCISEFAPNHYLGWPFCLPNSKAGSRGYWGRDHLNNEGIPPDNLRRTVWGLYPAGGRYDNDTQAPVNNINLGNQGAGIQPIMLAAFVDFMLAEAASTLGTSGDAKALMISGIQKHMNYVRSFAMGSLEAGAINTFEGPNAFNNGVTAYLNVVGNQYDAATNKMDIIGREYWLSLYGNGIESYNLYRRTGKPARMQPGLLNAGTGATFPRSMIYPNDHMVTNRNAVQKPNGLKTQVFWDTNPASGFPNGHVY